MRWRVIANCALVGIPRRIVLTCISTSTITISFMNDLLLYLKKFLPLGKFPIQEGQSSPDDWIPEERKTNDESVGFHEHVRRSDRRDQ